MDSYDNDAFFLLLDDDNFWKEENDVSLLLADNVTRAASDPG